MTVTLTICIPTYNRSECLRECLSSVLSSVAGHENEIEIVISDNASTDDTRNIVRGFEESHPWIRYHRNEKNIGAERNFYLLATLARGDYIWIFGDDDKMEHDAVGRVLAQTQLGYGLMICNYSMWDKSFTNRYAMDALHLGNDRSIETPDELLRRFGLHLSYCSSIVMKKSHFLNLPVHEYESFADYGMSIMYAVYSGAAQGNCRTAYISSPIVCNRGGNGANYDWGKYFVTGSALVFDALAGKGYTKDSVRYAKHKVLARVLFPHLLYTKFLDNYNQERVIELLFQHYKKDWVFWSACLPAWLVPGFLVRFARSIIRMTRKVKT